MMSIVKTYLRNSIAIFLILISCSAFAQKQDRIWLFADSAGIDFNDLANPIAITSNITNPCLAAFTSIANNQGELLFYSAGVDLTILPMRIFDKNGSVMQNGDTLKGYPWVGQGNMIIPFPNDSNKYYVFIADRDGAIGNSMYYSIVDMSLNNGLGSVISRNNLFLTDHVNEKLNAVKHANGRDWWVILQSTNTDSLFHKFLISPQGISSSVQKIGSGNNVNKAFGQMIFSRDGTKLGLVSSNATVDIFDFDRCTGELYNYKAAGEGITSLPNYYFGCSFSSNGSVFYTSSVWYEYKNIYQYDLTATDIKATKQLIFSHPDTGAMQFIQMGEHLLGPDDKIYVVKGTGFNGTNWDTYYTHHMDVISNPDQLGASCNYIPNSFDLGTGKTMVGLPTILNYNLGPVSGSICDSLTSNLTKLDIENVIKIFPNPFQNKIEIHSQSISGKIVVLNEFGKIIIEEKFDGNKTIDTSELSQGVYFVRVEALEWIMTRKFVKVD